jgi:hypothetical protein
MLLLTKANRNCCFLETLTSILPFIFLTCRKYSANQNATAVSQNVRRNRGRNVQTPIKHMKSKETISWIFLATAIASETSSTDFRGISQIADGINHAVPTHQEMQISVTWLIANDLITKNGKKYCLSEKGKRVFQKIQVRNQTLINIWKNLEYEITLINSDIA